MIANSYSELRWVRGIDKDIPFPTIIFDNDHNFSGCYYHPEDSIVNVNGREFELKNGLIIFNIDFGDPSTLAHEWRHHWQWYNGWKVDSILPNYEIGYKEAMIEFYSNSISELDALLFEIKKSPDDTNQEWYEWICSRDVIGRRARPKI